MKRAKIMLVATLVIGIAGVSLAFKAKRSNICYYERHNNPGLCTTVVPDLFRTGAVITSGVTYNTTLAKASDECPEPNKVNCLTKHSRVGE